MNAGNVFFFVIIYKQTNKLKGAVTIRDPQVYAGQLHSWINEQFWGHNRYQEALKLLSDYFFPKLINHTTLRMLIVK